MLNLFLLFLFFWHCLFYFLFLVFSYSLLLLSVLVILYIKTNDLLSLSPSGSTILFFLIYSLHFPYPPSSFSFLFLSLSCFFSCHCSLGVAELRGQQEVLPRISSYFFLECRAHASSVRTNRKHVNFFIGMLTVSLKHFIQNHSDWLCSHVNHLIMLKWY